MYPDRATPRTTPLSQRELDSLRSSAEAVFAPGHGQWIGPDHKPGMSLPKADMLWLLDELDRLRSHVVETAPADRIIAPYGMIGDRPRELHECD